MEKFETIIDYFSTDDVLFKRTTGFRQDWYQSAWASGYSDSMEGIGHETKQMLERARANVQTAVHRSLSFTYDLLQENVRTSLIELYGDLRLLASLVIFPIEEKMKLKDQLIGEGFEQVVEFLEIAEQNYALTPPHLKDTLSNCRNALEATVTLLLRKFGLQPVQKFSIDLGMLLKNDFVDRETKDVVLSIWSYLSMKGSHSYAKVTKELISDVDFGLEQTYRVISQLLTKYQSCQK